MIAPNSHDVVDDENDNDHDNYDACEELFRRGEMLRKLRQLEREDEELRQQQQQVDNDDKEGSSSSSSSSISSSIVENSNTLCYKKYLKNQGGIYDDYKHVNFQYVDFGTIDDASGDDIDSNNNSNNNNNNNSSITKSQQQQSHLIIEQDRRLGKGGFIWDAGFILAQSVLRMEEREKEWLFPTSRQHRVIELGAGTGVTSLMIARSYPSSKVHLTDMPLLQPLLEKNCKSCTNATHSVLEWGKPVNETYDVILAADVVAGIYDSAALAKTICDLSHEKTMIYLACRERLSGVIDRFESYMNELFTRVERRLPDSTNKSPDVFIICISGKRMYQ